TEAVRSRIRAVVCFCFYYHSAYTVDQKGQANKLWCDNMGRF
ncbi:MAG: hypothetical protein JWP29_5520, partial [Rhodoferax sp.]|nr:hypothetical protein [Rhodoferax sp.]